MKFAMAVCSALACGALIGGAGPVSAAESVVPETTELTGARDVSRDAYEVSDNATTVIWRAEVGGVDGTLLARTRVGGSWSEPVTIASGAGEFDLSADGHTVVWLTQRPAGEAAIGLARFTNGQWVAQPLLPITTSATEVAVLDDGATAIWVNGDARSYAINAAGGWTGIRPAPSGGWIGTGGMHIAFSYPPGGDTVITGMVARRYAGGQWQQPVAIPLDIYLERLALAADGTSVAAYGYDSAGIDDLYVTSFRGGQWSEFTRLGNGQQAEMSQLSRDGSTLTWHSDNTNSTWATRLVGGSWLPAREIVPRLPEDQSYPRAVADNGSVLAARYPQLFLATFDSRTWEAGPPISSSLIEHDVRLGADGRSIWWVSRAADSRILLNLARIGTATVDAEPPARGPAPVVAGVSAADPTVAGAVKRHLRAGRSTALPSVTTGNQPIVWTTNTKRRCGIVTGKGGVVRVKAKRPGMCVIVANSAPSGQWLGLSEPREVRIKRSRVG